MPDTPHASLSPRHAALVLAVMAVWGTNFVVIKLALGVLPPLFFATLRFFFAVFPLVFFLRRPAVAWRHLAAYGLLIGVGQFGILYIAMRADISPGLASLVIQMQVFFTIGLSVVLTAERVHPFQWAALGLAAAGLGVILAHNDGGTTALGLGLVLFAALSWACGNIVARASGAVNMVAYIAWASLFSVPPLLLLSLVFEGWPAIVHGVSHAGAPVWAAVLWQSIANTMFGYGSWGFLLARYPAATVSPAALLVPVFGMGASALLLGEALPAWKLIAAFLVLSGLAVNLLWPLLRRSGA